MDPRSNSPITSTGFVGIGTATPQAMLDVRGNVTSTGNVGIGTQAPLSKLDVRGNIRLGSSGQYLATGGEENLRIVRGSVWIDATILAGTGFSAGCATDL